MRTTAVRAGTEETSLLRKVDRETEDVQISTRIRLFGLGRHLGYWNGRDESKKRCQNMTEWPSIKRIYAYHIHANASYSQLSKDQTYKGTPATLYPDIQSAFLFSK